VQKLAQVSDGTSFFLGCCKMLKSCSLVKNSYKKSCSLVQKLVQPLKKLVQKLMQKLVQKLVQAVVGILQGVVQLVPSPKWQDAAEWGDASVHFGIAISDSANCRRGSLRNRILLRVS